MAEYAPVTLGVQKQGPNVALIKQGQPNLCRQPETPSCLPVAVTGATLSNAAKKYCYKCRQDVSITCFRKNRAKKDGLSDECNSCHAKYQRYRWWHQTITEQMRTKHYARNKRYSKTEKGKLSHRRSYIKWAHSAKGLLSIRRSIKKYNSSPTGRLRCSLTQHLYRALKQNKAGRAWEQLVGYNVHQLKAHLESQFEPGMTWENYGRNGWNIDHIVPIVEFSKYAFDSSAIQTCFALSNLMPRWETTKIAQTYGSAQIGNFNKGSKILQGMTI